MRKIKLEMESLEVESFATVGGGAADGGTVEGLGWSEQWNSNCCQESASVPVACICDSNNGTCETTCNPHYCPTCGDPRFCPAETDLCA